MDQSTVIAFGIVKAVLMLVAVGIALMGLIWLFIGVQSLLENIGQFIVRKWKVLVGLNTKKSDGRILINDYIFFEVRIM